jgi:SAM-dependent methyltransferase
MSGKTADPSYFETYGPGGSRSYEDSWRDFTFEPSDVLPLYKALFGSKPKTLLDLGAANGALVSAFLRRGVDALGLERSAYIHKKITDKNLKKRILLGDVLTLLPKVPSASFDMVLDCTAQYLPRKSLPRHLRQVKRVCKNLCCLLVQFREKKDPPHQAVTLFETKTWWKARMRAAGFKHVPGGEGFFYVHQR